MDSEDQPEHGSEEISEIASWAASIPWRTLVSLSARQRTTSINRRPPAVEMHPLPRGRSYAFKHGKRHMDEGAGLWD